MTAMTDFMMARSVVPAAKFFAVADEIALEGVDHEHIMEESYKVVAKEGYEHWGDLVFDVYQAMSKAAEYYMEVYISNGDEPCDYEEIGVWESALNDDLFPRFGWVHRIVNVINHYRKPNGAHPAMGDIEHCLMMNAIRDRLKQLPTR